MPKNYSLGRNRHLAVEKLDGDLLVTIAEEGSDVKTITFPSRRCVQFVKTIGQRAAQRMCVRTFNRKMTGENSPKVTCCVTSLPRKSHYAIKRVCFPVGTRLRRV